jgi:hypothetical protein
MTSSTAEKHHHLNRSFCKQKRQISVAALKIPSYTWRKQSAPGNNSAKKKKKPNYIQPQKKPEKQPESSGEPPRRATRNRGGKKKNKETVSVCISYFSPNPRPKAELRSTSQKTKNTRLGQNFQNPKKEKQTYNRLFSLFFCSSFPSDGRGTREKTHQDKTPAEQNDGGRARSEDKQRKRCEAKNRRSHSRTETEPKKKKKQEDQKKSKLIFFIKKGHLFWDPLLI